MAGTFPFSALPNRMNKLGGNIARGISRLVQDIAEGIGATVVDTTAVDTGLARSNWRATLSVPASGIIPPYAPGIKLGIGEGANASAAKAQQRQVIRRFNVNKHNSIFITNNVHYIGALNAGSSPQSAGAMVALGFQTGRAILQVRSGKVLDTK
jgi:hypothetical protein